MSALDNDDETLKPKPVAEERLRRWRQAALELNSIRRFRYASNLKREGNTANQLPNKPMVDDDDDNDDGGDSDSDSDGEDDGYNDNENDNNNDKNDYMDGKDAEGYYKENSLLIRNMSTRSSMSTEKQLGFENKVEQVGLPDAVEDPYGGVRINVQENMDSEILASLLRASILHWRHQEKKAIWIKLPIHCYNLLDTVVQAGFRYHHAEPDYLMLVLWLPSIPDTLPVNASHQVGVGTYVANINKKPNKSMVYVDDRYKEDDSELDRFNSDNDDDNNKNDYNNGNDAEDDVGLDPKDIKLVMEQTMVSRSRAVEALKTADGDLVGAMMEITMEPNWTMVEDKDGKDNTKDANDDDENGKDAKGGNDVEFCSKDSMKAKLDASLEKGHGGDHVDGKCRGKRVRRAGFRRTRAKIAIRDQRHAVQPTPLLTGLKSHPSIYIRLGQRPPERNLVSQNTWARAFKICSNAAVEYKRLLREAGFGDFLRIQPFRISLGGHMSALVERYFSETHTLHLGTFEIGPTPLAWTMITGIRFGGDPLKPPDITHEECVKLLGLVGTEPEGVFSKDKVKLDVLCPLTLDFSKKPAKSDLDWMYRRLILYLVGSCFFSGTDMMVPIRLVSAMRNIEKINRYDWGAATFSAFLRGMRQKTSECCGTFSGFYPFLLLWAYEHIPYMRPLNKFDIDVFPRACRWDLTKMEAPNSNDFTWYRLELEYLEEDEVDFDPYKELLEKEDFEYESALSQERIAFLGLESWEVYMGERNLRQFGGGVQIPCSPPLERFGEQSQILTAAAMKLLQGVDAWDLLEDEECNYVEWFRANSLGRIIALDQFQGRKILGGRLLELWLRVRQDGHKVMSPQDLQALEDAKTKWKEKCRSAEAKLKECIAESKTLKEGLDHWKSIAECPSADIDLWQSQVSNAEARVAELNRRYKKWMYFACIIIVKLYLFQFYFVIVK